MALTYSATTPTVGNEQTVCNHLLLNSIAISTPGVIGVGTMATFGADTNNFENQYPELRQADNSVTPLHLLGLKAIFQIPLFREWVMMHGHATPGKKTMLRLLSQGKQCFGSYNSRIRLIE
jgi:hypothetical protein